jgi:hypothetical protein
MYRDVLTLCVRLRLLEAAHRQQRGSGEGRKRASGQLTGGAERRRAGTLSGCADDFAAANGGTSPYSDPATIMLGDSRRMRGLTADNP